MKPSVSENFREQKTAPPESQTKQIVLRLSPKVATLLVVLLLLPTLLLAYLIIKTTTDKRADANSPYRMSLANSDPGHFHATTIAGSPSTVSTTNSVKNIPCKPGPWGNVEYTRMMIEIPDEYVAARLHETDLPNWNFRGFTKETLTQFFTAAGLKEAEAKDLLNYSKWENFANGIRLKPARETVLSLSREARERIYSTLAQFEENAAQDQAFSFAADSFDERFENKGLARETVDLVKRLCYPRGNLLMFADLPTVLSALQNYDEKFRLEKVISGRRTLLATLRLTKDSDINALVAYWGRAGTGKDVKPLLESLKDIPDGIRVNLMTLLPPWPTARLYTYPFPSASKPEDCHWTSFNFFKDKPDPTSDNGAIWKQKLDTEYYPVNSDPRYGDLVMLAKPAGNIIHSCVFLADDIVYTKNGANCTAPWMLMRIPDLVEAYSSFVGPEEGLKVLYYRNKYY